ncbi:MAG: stage II sporulation protein M [Candidatus Cyclobacteriaceae bacterium M3_2C_046]
MRESVFIANNQKKWHEFELMLNSGGDKTNPDLLADLYIQITDDLSFAQTQYPQSRTHNYLNGLASKIHQAIYRNKREKSSRFITFWQEELPRIFYENKKPLGYSFLIFSLSILIGAISAAHDPTFVRLILGDQYVEMTLENISKGEPMGVYHSMSSNIMFLQITLNNIMVSFATFAYGVLLSAGTVYHLFQNGVMLGSFQYFFYQQGLFITSFLTIWIHGTLEISSIIIAGGAGLIMGNSFLFPGTYHRLVSVKNGAKKGLKIIIGIVPLFILAGFLESYITRLSNMHWSIKLGIILISLSFIIYYVVIFPNKKYRHEYGKN